MAATIFERYGGFAKVSRIVSAFYDHVLASPLLSPYFEGVDMRRLIDHQTKFIAAIMGGPASFSNEALERAHRNLGITDEAFREALEDNGVDESDIAVICTAVIERKPYIVVHR